MDRSGAEPRPAAAGQPPLRPALPPRVRNRNHALKRRSNRGIAQSGGSAPERTAIVCVSGIFAGLQ